MLPTHLPVYAALAGALQRGETATLALVIDAAGHTPQVAGARMARLGDGQLEGTVGGGRFEHAIVERLATLTRPERLTLQLGAELGMCCGGRMEALLTPITALDAEWLSALVERIAAGQPVTLATGLDAAHLGHRRLLAAEPDLHGDRRYASAGRATLEGAQWHVEHLEPAHRLLVFGAGHVAKPTAALGSLLGYDVHVIDDRADWCSPARFAEPAVRHVMPHEDFLADYAPRGSDAVVIVTQSHDHDHALVEAFAEQPIAYLGLIGSQTKVEKTRRRLRTRGVTDDRIAHLHAPIGLDLGALTPEEIAVAIAAELVQTRRMGDPR